MLCSSRAATSRLAQTLVPSRDGKTGPTLTSLEFPHGSPASVGKCHSLKASRKLSVAYKANLPHFCTSNNYVPRTQGLGWTLSPSLMLNTKDMGAGTTAASSRLQEQPEEECYQVHPFRLLGSTLYHVSTLPTTPTLVTVCPTVSEAHSQPISSNCRWEPTSEEGTRYIA